MICMTTINIQETIIFVDTTWVKGERLALDLWYEGQGRIGKNGLNATVGVDANEEGIDIIVDNKDNYEGELTFTCHLKNKNDENKLKDYDCRRWKKNKNF